MSMFSRKSNPKFNVVFVIDSLQVGGAESQIVMLAEGLHKRGYHCEVFALSAEGAFKSRLKSQGIPLINGGFSKGRDRLALLRGMWRLWKSIRRNKPCVVQSYLPLSNFIGSFVARLAGASAIVTSRRGLGIHQENGSRWKYLDRISNVLSSKVSVNSKAVGDDTIKRDGIDSNKVVCIYNGLDTSRFNFSSDMRESMRLKLGLSSSDFAWVKVANLVDYKGHLDLLHAFSLVHCNLSPRLFLVGRDLGMQRSLQEKASELGIEDKIVFLDDCNNVPEVLSAMDAFVFASHTEGFSNAILEAMAAGLPIIATTVGGNAEALKNGEFGIMVKPHDHDALRNSMEIIMNNQELREKLSVTAKQNVLQEYSLETMVSAYSRLYLSAVKK